MNIQQAEITTAQMISAERWGRLADVLCYVRQVGACVLAAHNLPRRQPRSWVWTGTVAGVHITDLLDGPAARKKAEILGRPTTDGGKKLDQESDKIAHLAITGSQAINAWRRGEYGFAAVSLATLLADHGRDRIVNRRRDQAREIGRLTGQKIEIGPTLAGKLKTNATGTVETLAQSPLANNAAARIGLGIARVACTALSLYSGAKTIDRINRDIAADLETLPPDHPNRPAAEALAIISPSEQILDQIGKLFTMRRQQPQRPASDSGDFTELHAVEAAHDDVFA